MTFHDIFSSKPEKSKEKPLVVVDHREKSSSVVAELMKKQILLKFEQLPIADYLIRDIAIERKTVQDFKASIINKRIFDQIHNLKQYPRHLMMLEGILEENLYTGGMHENAFRGFMLSLALDYQVNIIFTHNAADTANYLAVLAHKPERKSALSLRFTPSALTSEQQVQYILEGFPHIGPVSAQKLLAHFGSLKKIFDASEKDLEPVIGKKSESFYRMLVTTMSQKNDAQVWLKND